jgi:hypothetical protein
MATNVQVCCRFRPAAANEAGASRCIQINPNRTSVSLLVDNPSLLLDDGGARQPSLTFTYDAVFDSAASQADVFDKTTAHFISDIFGGYNTTIFACQSAVQRRCLLSSSDRTVCHCTTDRCGAAVCCSRCCVQMDRQAAVSCSLLGCE